MIRPGRFGDIPRLTDIIVDAHARSIYADRCGVDLKETRSLLMQLLQRDKTKVRGGTCLFVGEGEQVEGFIAGVVDRVYHVGDKLAVQDMFFVASLDAAPRDAGHLIDAYVGWAETIPNRLVTFLSATNVIGPTKRVERLFVRKGFTSCGVIFEKRSA